MIAARFGEDTDARIRKIVAKALCNKAGTLYDLGRPADAIDVYKALVNRFGEDPAPGVREVVARTLLFKSGVLLRPAARPTTARGSVRRCAESLVRSHRLHGQLTAIPTVGLLRCRPPIEPRNGAPKAKMAPSAPGTVWVPAALAVQEAPVHEAPVADPEPSGAMLNVGLGGDDVTAVLVLVDAGGSVGRAHRAGGDGGGGGAQRHGGRRADGDGQRRPDGGRS